MLEENKNPKVTEHSSLSSSLDKGRVGEGLVSYTKTNKLITALYIVTDIMDKEEPLRNKLRTLGVNIISDTHLVSRATLDTNISEVLSLLDIASAIGMISQMNCNILKKEFLELKQSIREPNTQDDPEWLEEFFTEVPPPQKTSIGHIGVQKGSTLLKALSGIEMSNRTTSSDFNLLKKQRRDKILKIIKDKPNSNGVSIKDIVLALRGSGEKWGEKTLQRELVSMVQDGVLEKTGEKRWSRYLIRN